MRKLIYPAAALAALALSASPSQAQIIIGGGTPYYGGYSTPVGQGGIVQQVEGQVLSSVVGGTGYSNGGILQSFGGQFLGGTGYNSYPAYSSGYGFSNYGYQPYYGSGYSTYGTQSYYGGRGFGRRYR